MTPGKVVGSDFGRCSGRCAGSMVSWAKAEQQNNKVLGGFGWGLKHRGTLGYWGIEAFTATGWYRPVEAQRYRKSSWDAGDRLMGTETLGNIGAGIFSRPGWRWSS